MKITDTTPEIVLFDEPLTRQNLLPFTFTRPLALLRCGILRIVEKWQALRFQTGVLAQPYLQKKFPFQSVTTSSEQFYINGALCPTPHTMGLLSALSFGESVWQGEQLIACRLESGISSPEYLVEKCLNYGLKTDYSGDLGNFICNLWDLTEFNKSEIVADFSRVVGGRQSAKISDRHTIVYGKDNLFVEEGAQIRAAIINAEEGLVYVGKNALVGEGAVIKNTFALCEGAEVAAGAKIKGDTTIGPRARVGGELSKSVFLGRSNKIHDGYLGNSVVGEWCNLGAGTNGSNLKNTYAEVKIWSYRKNAPQNTGLQFCGLFMGDHVKCAIGTLFNTGTVVGVGANIFGEGFPPKFVPSFAWGGAGKMQTGRLEKITQLAGKVLRRKNHPFTPADAEILRHIYQKTAQYRIWDSVG